MSILPSQRELEATRVEAARDAARSQIEAVRVVEMTARVPGMPSFFVIAGAVAVGVFLGAWLFALTYREYVAAKIQRAIDPYSIGR